jgi:RES domain-containing protein
MSNALPQTVFRITRAIYAKNVSEALSGVGGLHDDGRWHTRGRPIIYTGESSSICLLERLVHADEWIADRLPGRVVLTINVPGLSFTHYTAAEISAVDPNWRDEGNPTCRSLGDNWLAQNRYCAIIVPSAADPMARNVLFNPVHADAAALITANTALITTPIDLDDRVVSLAQERRARAARA